MARSSNNQSLFDMMRRVAGESGVSFDVMRRFAGIESSFNPGAKTGSYKGLFQLSNAEFKRGGGKGSIYNPEANTRAFANVIKDKSAAFEKKMGRAPTGPDLYMMHQQGEQGGVNHLRNPDAPAWQNMHATGEGRQKGERWAKRAIWGNVPAQMKKQFGSVENVSSRDFTGMWSARYNREGRGGDWGPKESTGRAKLRAPDAVPDMPSKRMAADMPSTKQITDRLPQDAPDTSFGQDIGLHSYKTLAQEVQPNGKPVAAEPKGTMGMTLPNGVQFGGAPIDAQTGAPYQPPGGGVGVGAQAPPMPQRRPELEGLTPGGSNVYGENPPVSQSAASAAPSSRPQGIASSDPSSGMGGAGVGNAQQNSFSREELNRIFGGSFGDLYGAPSDRMSSGPVRIDPPPAPPPLNKDYLYPMFSGGFGGGIGSWGNGSW